MNTARPHAIFKRLTRIMFTNNTGLTDIKIVALYSDLRWLQDPLLCLIHTCRSRLPAMCMSLQVRLATAHNKTTPIF